MIRNLLGSDGLDFITYFLLTYYQNHKSYNADILTFTIRIGDTV